MINNKNNKVKNSIKNKSKKINYINNKHHRSLELKKIFYKNKQL